MTLYSKTYKPRSTELSFPEWDLLPTIPPRRIFQEVGTSPHIPKVDKGYPGQEDLPTPLQSDTLSIALLVLSKSRASGNIIFPTSQSDGKGVPKWASDRLVQLASAFVGVKLLCLNKPANVCGPKNLDYFKTKLSWGWGKARGRVRSEERENLQVCTLILASLWIGFTWGFASWVQGCGLMLFNSQPVLCSFSLWFPCSHQAGAAAWVSALWHKQEKMAGQNVTGWSCQTCLDHFSLNSQ